MREPAPEMPSGFSPLFLFPVLEAFPLNHRSPITNHGRQPPKGSTAGGTVAVGAVMFENRSVAATAQSMKGLG